MEVLCHSWRQLLEVVQGRLHAQELLEESEREGDVHQALVVQGHATDRAQDEEAIACQLGEAVRHVITVLIMWTIVN